VLTNPELKYLRIKVKVFDRYEQSESYTTPPRYGHPARNEHTPFSAPTIALQAMRGPCRHAEELRTGTMIDYRFRAEEFVERAILDESIQYLYSEATASIS
jgi:hypothetical protein